MSKKLGSFRLFNTKMDLESIKQHKKQLRKRIQLTLNAISQDEIVKQSSAISRKALSLREYKDANSLSIFLSMPGKEVSTQEIVRQAFEDGKQVYVPYVHPSELDSKLKIMDMLRLNNEDDLMSLQPDAWGIPSISIDSVKSRENALGGLGCLPEGSGDSSGAMKLDLIFMPSMAFDSSLNRLGHGKGFYDRYLTLCQSISSQEQAPKMPRLIGLALKEQMLPPGELLPVDHRDWKVDKIVTAEN